MRRNDIDIPVTPIRHAKLAVAWYRCSCFSSTEQRCPTANTSEHENKILLCFSSTRSTKPRFAMIGLLQTTGYIRAVHHRRSHSVPYFPLQYRAAHIRIDTRTVRLCCCLMMVYSTLITCACALASLMKS